MSGRKKCSECLGCFDAFWIDGKRYYHCVLCQTTYEGRDDDLHQCKDPRNPNNKVIVEEQSDGTEEIKSG